MEPEEIAQLMASLSPADQQLAHDFIAFLRWRAAEGDQLRASRAPAWQYSFLEHMDTADVRATKKVSGMEVRTAEASVAGAERPALWQHPPIEGESVVEFHVPIPANAKNVRLRFATGIRDDTQGTGQLVAFRIRVDGWQVWSRAAYPRHWESAEVPLPFHAGNVSRIAFVTDGLGNHRFAWAAWAEPELVGDLDAPPTES